MKKKNNLYSRPKIITEISGNHNGNKKRFLKLVEKAFESGADLVKIQTYEARDITLNIKSKKFRINSGPWKNSYLWDLYKKACTPFNWHKDAFKIAKKFKKKIFSSPFSLRAVDFLEKLNCPIYKIASFEITDHKLVDYIASKKKPIILSTGMSEISEIKKTIRLISKYHNNITILHCVSDYPTVIQNSNLSKISKLKKSFPKFKIGLSDHTNGIASSLIAAQMGVTFIEKHFNLDDMKTPDSLFSINPAQLKELTSAIKYISNMKNKNTSIRKKNLFLRRSIFSTKKIKKNEKITSNNIDTLRPSIGICASKYFSVLNKRARKNIEKNSPLFSSDVI
jgi:pseudaminic acid synthase